MKAVIAVILGLCCASSAALASEPDTSPSPLPSAPSVQQMGIPPAQGLQIHSMMLNIERTHTQMQQSQLALRRDILAVLNPAQRTVVAAAVGQLAIAVNPDTASAARQVQSLLSAVQRQAIEQCLTNAFMRNEAISQQLTAQAEGSVPADQQMQRQQMGRTMQLQFHDRMLDALRSQSFGAIVIAVLSTPTASAMGMFGRPSTIVGPK